MPDGVILRNVPQGTSKEDIMARYGKSSVARKKAQYPRLKELEAYRNRKHFNAAGKAIPEEGLHTGEISSLAMTAVPVGRAAKGAYTLGRAGIQAAKPALKSGRKFMSSLAPEAKAYAWDTAKGLAAERAVDALIDVPVVGGVIGAVRPLYRKYKKGKRAYDKLSGIYHP